MWAESSAARETDTRRKRLLGKENHICCFLSVILNHNLADEFVRVGSRGLTDITKPSIYTFIAFIYPAQTASTSQITHLHCLYPRSLTFIPRSCLTCKCQCWHYYAIVMPFFLFLSPCSLSYHSSHASRILPLSSLVLSP